MGYIKIKVLIDVILFAIFSAASFAIIKQICARRFCCVERNRYYAGFLYEDVYVFFHKIDAVVSVAGFNDAMTTIVSWMTEILAFYEGVEA